ncbi:hypothetical protein JVX93_21515 [Mycolicibacterium boenickei]|nr:hypothetical protein JVX93_21515 [Mycolicibacterium boenickei]
MSFYNIEVDDLDVELRHANDLKPHDTPRNFAPTVDQRMFVQVINGFDAHSPQDAHIAVRRKPAGYPQVVLSTGGELSPETRLRHPD